MSGGARTVRNDEGDVSGPLFQSLFQTTTLGAPWWEAVARAVLPPFDTQATVAERALAALAEERADPVRRHTLDKVLAYDRDTGYTGEKFGLCGTDVQFNDPDVRSVRECGGADLPPSQFDAAVLRMQDTLDEYGLDHAPGMSEQAYRIMYEHLKELREAAIKEKVHDAERRTVIGVIQECPRALRDTPQLHEYIHPEILHRCAHGFATTQLQRLLHVNMHAKSDTEGCTLLMQRVGDTPARVQMTTSVHTLNSIKSICKAIDSAKIAWLRQACRDIIPQWLPAGSPGHEEWLEQNLGVVRQTIFAFARLGIAQTFILFDTLRDRGYTDSETLFLKDHKEIYLRVVRKPLSEHMLNQASTIGTGPTLRDIVRVQPGFMAWVGRNAEFVGAVGTTLYKEVAWVQACGVARRSLAAERDALRVQGGRDRQLEYLKVFPTLEGLIGKPEYARAPTSTSTYAPGPARHARQRSRRSRANNASSNGRRRP